ncbi:VOC family protein [Spirochaeta lutea]|uniref:Glyoxalase n=1 Tax=Spirochaeta lutea TaxID=1480694 RepID=A0A098QXQ5_9SPIO|nr:VOC family protein [Spirochaeta lutea]KGE72218.1 glyoxalase [Spirochaeta lutea]
MQLGAFSISLAVKDLQASKAFYEALGFTVFGGQAEHHYLIMKNGPAIIGLFQGMFSQNILTFNPRWDQECNTLENLPDVRDIHAEVRRQGLKTEQEALESESGPGSFVIVDPDGNPVLIDQHC